MSLRKVVFLLSTILSCSECLLATKTTVSLQHADTEPLCQRGCLSCAHLPERGRSHRPLPAGPNTRQKRARKKKREELPSENLNPLHSRGKELPVFPSSPSPLQLPIPQQTDMASFLVTLQESRVEGGRFGKEQVRLTNSAHCFSQDSPGIQQGKGIR